ncbi:hypothetical protein N7490_002726 [Penicillium lividum]|nr:hypothetical protein N7490_002726 [Penicillium lividum]
MASPVDTRVGRSQCHPASGMASDKTSTFCTPLPEHTSSRFPGDLSVLPLELVWLILDHIIMNTPQLTHSGLCSIRNLALTNKEFAAHVDEYIRRDTAVNYIQRIAQNTTWWTYNTADGSMDENDTPLKPITSEVSNVISGTIRDDCTDCSMWLQKVIPGLDGTGVNEYGWSFIAIAAHHASLKMLKFFFTTKGYHGPCIQLLSYPANLMRPRISTMRMITDEHNLEFLRALFEFLGPRIRELNYPDRTDGRLTREEEYCLCTFVTPAFAEQLESIGLALYKTRDIPPSNRNAYHAAVTNSVEFLDYLHANSSLPMNEPNRAGEAPLHYAIRANQLQSVLWLDKHVAKQDYNVWSRLTAGHIAVRMTSQESEEILKAVLPMSGFGVLDSGTSGTMLRTLMEGLRETILSKAVGSNIQKQDYVAFRDMHEERAIRKYRLMMNLLTDDNMYRFGGFEVSLRNFHRSGVRQFKYAKDMAMSLDFQKLGRAIEA